MSDFRQACVLGWPITHSLSPLLHGHWLRRYGLPGAYTARGVEPKDLQQTLRILQAEGFAGCNLTLPLKEYALDLLDDADASCKAAGAVNTIVFDQGRVRGWNSDGFGFLESLKSQAPHWRGDRIVLLGTGGAARGIAAALQGAGATSFVLINRTLQKAYDMADALSLNADIVPWEDRHEGLKHASVLVHCSALGMRGQPPLDLDLRLLPPDAVVADIVYRPLETDLLRVARTRGHVVVEGLSMLLHQGRLGFQKWFGQDPAVTSELYAEMAKAASA